MALKRNETYPGRFSNPTDDHPQGAFKNRSAPGAQDGSYLEQQWANDWDGFFGRLLTLAEISPNGNVDTASSSQYYDALKSLFLQRTDPFADIKADDTVETALENLGLGAGAPAIGIPFFWPSSAMPNTVMTEWSDMVFLKFNGATFSALTYPKLALIIPSLTLPDARGEFPRIWDDGRGVDSGRELLSSQGGGAPNITGTMTSIGVISGVSSSGAITGLNSGNVSNLAEGNLSATFNFSFDASRSSSLYQSISEVRPRNIAFNLLVRAK